MLHNFEMVFRLPNTNADPLEYAPSLFESVPGVVSVDAGERGQIRLDFCIKGASLRPLAFNLMTQVRELIPGAVLIRFSQHPPKREQVS